MVGTKVACDHSGFNFFPGQKHCSCVSGLEAMGPHIRARMCVCVCVFKIYLFIELSWVFVAARGLFSSCSETGLFSNCSAQASHCDGSPYCRAWLSAHRLQKLQLVGSLVAALGR